eukprot:326590-Rhodomonas_salina.2
MRRASCLNTIANSPTNPNAGPAKPSETDTNSHMLNNCYPPAAQIPMSQTRNTHLLASPQTRQTPLQRHRPVAQYAQTCPPVRLYLTRSAARTMNLLHRRYQRQQDLHKWQQRIHKYQQRSHRQQQRLCKCHRQHQSRSSRCMHACRAGAWGRAAVTWSERGRPTPGRPAAPAPRTTASSDRAHNARG